MQLIDELPLTPQLKCEVDKICLHANALGESSRAYVIQQVKLRHYYGGMAVLCRRTPHGLAVVDTEESGQISRLLAKYNELPATERRAYKLYSPPTVESFADVRSNHARTRSTNTCER